MKKEKILITTAIPYVNGLPHLGHLAGNFLPADAYARYNRMIGNEVLFIGGTDEHGSPNEIGAEKAGMDVYDYVTKYHDMHRAIYEKFEFSFDYFGRTSSPNCTELTQRIARELSAAGFIGERETEQMYSIDDGRFLADRYVEGTCPYCGYEKARGDQCEMCTKLLDPKDLINPRSAISGSRNLEFRKTKHLYLLLSKLQGQIRGWVDTRDWQKLTKGIAYKWLDEGLSDRAITRDLKWGVPVPQDAFPDMKDKVFYVWFDAPIGYISMTKDALGEGYRKWWMLSEGAKDVKYVEFMGKDNVPFHSVFFPGMLIGTGRDYKLVDELKGLGFLNFAGGKFSKSENRGIFAEQALAEFAADYWRYFLMKNLPETDDTDFTFEKFAEDANKDLNDVLGNFVLRVLKFYASKFGTTVAHAPAAGKPESTARAKIAALSENYHAHMKGMEFRKAMADMREAWAAGNEYIDAAAPWSAYKQDPESAGEMLVFAMNLMAGFAALAAPSMPAFAGRILGLFGLSAGSFDMPEITKGAKFEAPEKMFEKIDDKRVEELNAKYNK
ncbi:MAG: methionine--tRNA ligase [Rickettsiales bacterium]|jgi:methionyl-tRNA synthetase|nr:methionine--tRNA ligase [Rickettsiales bacterium]